MGIENGRFSLTETYSPFRLNNKGYEIQGRETELLYQIHTLVKL